MLEPVGLLGAWGSLGELGYGFRSSLTQKNLLLLALLFSGFSDSSSDKDGWGFPLEADFFFGDLFRQAFRSVVFPRPRRLKLAMAKRGTPKTRLCLGPIPSGGWADRSCRTRDLEPDPQ